MLCEPERYSWLNKPRFAKVRSWVVHTLHALCVTSKHPSLPLPLFSPVWPENLGRLLVFELGCWQETPPEKEGIHPRAEISSAAVFLVKHKAGGRRLNQDGLVQAFFFVPGDPSAKCCGFLDQRSGRFPAGQAGGWAGALPGKGILLQAPKVKELRLWRQIPHYSVMLLGLMFSGRCRDDTKEWQKVIGRMKGYFSSPNPEALSKRGFVVGA